MLGHRRIGIQLAVHQHLAEQEVGAQLAREQAAVLAHPAQPGALAVGALEDRAGVAVPQGARARERLLLDPALERAEAVPHHAVVVLARGVARDASQAPVAGGVTRRLVHQRHAHHGAHLAQDAGGIGAARAAARGGEPPHLPVPAVGDPGLEALARLRGRGARDPHRVEAQLEGPGPHPLGDAHARPASAPAPAASARCCRAAPASRRPARGRGPSPSRARRPWPARAPRPGCVRARRSPARSRA